MKNLPIKNEYGYFEIRLESIGGLGANLCGKMLGELGAMYLGYNASSFASYGSEKRGSPVKSYIRWSDRNASTFVNTPIINPHVLVLFHEVLASKKEAILDITENTVLVVNTNMSPLEFAQKYNIRCKEILTIDALKIALETKSRVNMVMLGVICRAINFIDFETVEKMITNTVGVKYPNLLDKNIEAAKSGFEKQSRTILERNAQQFEPKDNTEKQNEMGYNIAPIGGVNPSFGNSITNDLSASREGYVPVFIKEKCINCGLCDITCPDMVFQFELGKYKDREQMVNNGLDYHHCKGCLRCVDICPTGALKAIIEAEFDTHKHTLRNKDLIIDKLDYEMVGPNSYVTSEGFANEKKVDGGI